MASAIAPVSISRRRLLNRPLTRSSASGSRKSSRCNGGKEGAHLLIQVRAKVINDELRQIFKGWYQDFDAGTDITQNVANSNEPSAMAA